MRYARTVVAAVTLWGCSGETVSPSPSPFSPYTPPTRDAVAYLWGMVIDESGVCIANASVRVVGGQGLGRTAVQEEPCGVWEYGGGFVLTGLTAGVAMTLRASAPGYFDKDTTVVPTSGAQTALLISPEK